MPADKTFTLGITMAGAVSAGAYTAGVLDFLLRAVADHNAAVGEDGGPEHKVVLKAMSGSSAGGISAALAVAGLAEGMAPREAVLKVGTDPSDEMTYAYGLRPLHEIWVKRVDLTQGDALLGVGDLRKGRLVSLINSEVIDRQAKIVLDEVRWNGERYDWLAADLEVFLTCTDLDGTAYVASFSGGEGGEDDLREGHAMAQHAVARHFRVQGMGTAQVDSPWLKAWQDDGVRLTPPAAGEAIPFHAELPDRGPAEPWSELRLTAFASGAFPVGLESRFVNLTADEIAPPRGERGRGGAMPYEIDPKRRPRPAHPDYREATRRIQMQTVDGGVCNNEPFELVRYTLRPAGRDGGLRPNPRDATNADRAVLMIDPFPEGPAYVPEAAKDPAEKGLLVSLGKLVPTLLNQARFKPLELVNAANRNVHSRWLIAPSRRRRAGDIEDASRDSRRRLRLGQDVDADGRRDGERGARALASGLLGGFGGFLHEDFRKHDFILGQRNCQSFLLNYFHVDAANPIEEGAPKQDPSGATKPIIQLSEALSDPIALPPWPIMPKRREEVLARMIDKRVQKVIVPLVSSASGAMGLLTRVYYGLGFSTRVEKKAMEAIERDLVAWDLRPERR
ncbi:MAG: patatin-like phospholipase family protein [Pseudomonadota bacterium]